MLKYFYTKFGDVFPGYEFPEMDYPEYTIVIQGTKKNDYKMLDHKDKSLERISEYGWVLGNEVIQATLDSDKFKPVVHNYQNDWWHGEYERKHLFIIGAGASAHCIYDTDKNDFYKDDLRAPLGPKLFDKRFKKYYLKYPGVKESLLHLQGDNISDVEALFEEEWKQIYKHNNQAILSRHINIQYYLQELLRDISNNIIESDYVKNLYASLAYKLQKIYKASVKNTYGKISHKKFAFVSFNQDTILEHFIAQYFNVPIKSMDDYIKPNEGPFCIFKPHGSWNWGWKFPNPDKFKGNTARWLFDNNINFFQLYYQLLGDHINMIDWSTFGTEESINKHRLGKFTIDKSQLQHIDSNKLNNYFPALILPYRDKDEFTMPLRHFMTMQSYIGYVETLVIIGWKGNEEAFNRILTTHGNKIQKVIIADPNPDIVEKNLQSLLTKPSVSVVRYNNFEDFILNGLEKEIN